MAFKPTVGIMSDAFSGAFRQKLELDQRQEQYDRSIQEQQRQQGLLELWKQRNFQQQQDQNAFMRRNTITDNLRQEKLVNAKIDNYKSDNERQAEQDRLNAEYRNAMLGYQKQELNQKNNQPTSPGDFSKGFGLLGKSWNNFQKYTGIKGNNSNQYPMVDNGKLVTYESSDVAQLRKGAFNDVVNQTNSLVKEINASYPGFEKHFNRAFQKIGKDPNQIDPYVESITDKEGKKLPEDAKRWLKEILKKRIF